MASPRRLAFKDRSVWELEQVVSAIFDDCDGFTNRFVFPDMTTRVPLVLELSQEEWTTLYSAILTGADLSYPNSSHDVENLFLQSVNCPMTQFCAAMIDCFQNDPDVWATMLTLLSENGVTGGVGDPTAPLSDDVLGGNLLPAGYTCTDDKAFGMALAVVESIHATTSEVLQAIEVLTNPAEIASELADNIPGVGLLSTAGDIARWIQNSADEQYQLAWSIPIRDELACLIWCAFKDDCVLNMDRIWDVYMGAADVTPPQGVLLTDWLAWLITLPFVASLSTVASVSLLGLLALRYGGRFGNFGLGIQSLATVMDLAQDDTSSQWSTVCDACVFEWCHEFDFTIDDQGWFPTFDACRGLDVGAYSPGVGWIATYLPGAAGCPSNYKALFANYTISAQIVRMEILYSMDWVNSTLGNRFRPAPGLWMNIPQEDRTDQLLTWIGNVAATSLNVSPYPAFDVGDQGSATLKRVRIWGTGTNPFGSSNC